MAWFVELEEEEVSEQVLVLEGVSEQVLVLEEISEQILKEVSVYHL